VIGDRGVLKVENGQRLDARVGTLAFATLFVDLEPDLLDLGRLKLEVELEVRIDLEDLAQVLFGLVEETLSCRRLGQEEIDRFRVAVTEIGRFRQTRQQLDGLSEEALVVQFLRLRERLRDLTPGRSGHPRCEYARQQPGKT